MGKKNKGMQNRVRKVASFTKRYGMTMTEWVEYKKTHTPAEVQAIRDKAYERV